MAIYNSNKYDANFTAGGIFFNEFYALKDILLHENFNELIKLEVEQNNKIGIATRSARTRVIREIKRRYNNVPFDFWTNFFTWNVYEQKLSLLYLCLKTYPLISDLHFEVIVKKYKTGQTLEAYDIQMRMDEISSFDNDVAKWSAITLKKINVHYRKALKDAGLYDGKLLLKESKASSSFWDYFKNNNESWFLEACFINK